MLHQVGAGTLGPVFRAHDSAEGRLVAVKAFRLDLTPEQAADLADALQGVVEQRLAHPSIAEPLAAGLEGGTPWLAQGYIAAEALDSALRQYGPPPVADALAIVTHLAGVLDFAAAAGVFHGSLHPRDVLVAPDETHVIDLGVAAALERCGLRAPQHRPYAAPERVDGGPVTREADIFALAAIAYELLTGQRVTGAGNDAFAAMPEVPGADVDALLETFSFALAVAPDERHATALAFVAPLKKALGEALGRPAPPRRRRTTRPEPLLPLAGDAGVSDESSPVAADPRDEPQADAGIVAADAFSEFRSELSEETASSRPDAPPIAPPPPASGDAPEESDAAPRGRGAPARRAPRKAPRADARTPAAVPPPGVEPPAEPFSDVSEPEPLLRDQTPAFARLDEPFPAAPLDDVSLSPAPTAETSLHWEPPDAPLEADVEPDRATAVPLPTDRWAPPTPAADRAPARQRSSSRSLLLVGLLVALSVGFAAGWFVARQQGSSPEQAGPSTDATASVREDTAPAAPPVQEVREPQLAEPADALRSEAADASRASTPPPPPPAERPTTARATPSRSAAEPAAVAKPSARVLLRSNPSGARVEINGRARGQTPLTVTDLAPGTYTIRVTRSGYAAAERRLTLPPGRRSQTLDFRLDRAAASRPQASPGAAREDAERPASGAERFTGGLLVESRPVGASVFLDGRLIGTTPLTVPDVRAGSHVVRMELEGHRRWSAAVQVVAGERTRVAASLEEEAVR